MNTQVAILGGGVIGLTTGIVLNLLGYKTKLYTEHRCDELCSTRLRPTVPSNHAAASIKPTRIALDNLSEDLKISQEIFRVLQKSKQSGVTERWFFEVFEEDVSPAQHLNTLSSFLKLEELNFQVPRRANAEQIFGWAFKCNFAQTPIYIPFLYSLYQKTGGEIELRKLDRESISCLKEEQLVNALGFGSREVFEDTCSYQLLKGIAVRVKCPMPIHRETKETFLLNYRSLGGYYVSEENEPWHVYAYPREDALLLGGTWLAGDLVDGKWQGEEFSGEVIKIDGIEVPKAIIDVNAEVIGSVCDLDLTKYQMQADFAYRYQRQAVCFDEEDFGSKRVFHNHGHGGSGVTFSWSSALRIAQKITGHNSSKELSLIELKSLLSSAI